MRPKLGSAFQAASWKWVNMAFVHMRFWQIVQITQIDNMRQ
jgi:hypothetical protein